MSTERNQVATALLAIVGGVCIVPALIVYRAFFLAIIWGWFAVPLFQLPALSVPFAIGLMCIRGAFSGNGSKSEEGGKYWFGVIVGPLFLLLVAYIAKQFI